MVSNMQKEMAEKGAIKEIERSCSSSFTTSCHSDIKAKCDSRFLHRDRSDHIPGYLFGTANSHRRTEWPTKTLHLGVIPTQDT